MISLGKSVLLLGLLSILTAQKMQGIERPFCFSDCKEKQEFGTQAGDWFTRLRALYLLPDDSSGSVNTIPNSGVSVHPTWTGGLILAICLLGILDLNLF